MTETMVDASKEHMGTESRSQETAGRKPSSRIPLLDRLSATRGIWELLDVQPEQIKRLLSSHQPGSFIVARNGDENAKTLFLRLPESDNKLVDLFPLEDHPDVSLLIQEGFKWCGSMNGFPKQVQTTGVICTT